GNYLGVLFWSALIGFALRTRKNSVKEVIDEFSLAITGVVQLIIAMAPLGIAGLVFDSVSSTGLAGLMQYGRLLLLLVGTMLIVDLIVYPLVAFVLIRQNPIPLFGSFERKCNSSLFHSKFCINIPINMMLAKRIGLTKESYSTLPLGANPWGGAAIIISIMTLTAVHIRNRCAF
ncbi:MAG: cation:dicarboxylate symporter family transporter, partial [Enterococcus sp.]|uniref:cation:dicarboxylate symporter family transporter n=1 Tax=Enterococcus sp. TaxID=35783 RepID=UPI003992AD47